MFASYSTLLPLQPTRNNREVWLGPALLPGLVAYATSTPPLAAVHSALRVAVAESVAAAASGLFLSATLQFYY